MDEARRHRRMKIPLKVEIYHESLGSLQVEASDMSDGGIFVLLDECFQIDVGEIVTLRTLGLGQDGSETSPPLSMRVARKTIEGMGLQIENSPSSFSANGPESSRYTTPQQSVLQSLCVINSQNEVLVLMHDEHWSLPSRELAFGESWQEGIEKSLKQLEQDAVIANPNKLHPDIQCFPSNHESSPLINLLVPCRVEPTAAVIDSALPAPYQWVQIERLKALKSNLDLVAVDNILSRV